MGCIEWIWVGRGDTILGTRRPAAVPLDHHFVPGRATRRGYAHRRPGRARAPTGVGRVPAFLLMHGLRLELARDEAQPIP